MLGCFAIFLAATVGCMLAPSIEVFLGFRLLQATIASGFALSRAIVRDMVPTDQAASLIGYVTMGMSLMPMVGPMIGGFLDESFGWQSVFVFTFVVRRAVTLALIWADLGETNRAPSASFAAQFRAYPELFRSRRFWGYSRDRRAGLGRLLRLPRRRALGGERGARHEPVAARLPLRLHRGRLHGRQLPLRALRRAGRASTA